MTGREKAAKPRRLPGDPSPRRRLEQMIRVDHAGEYGAVRIYEGQMAVLGQTPSAAVIRRMAAQEQRHLEKFDRLLAAHKVRPTALMPLWHVTGFLLGAGTALLGERAAMACTVAIEEVIDEHYGAQLADIDEGNEELRQTVEDFRRDEIEHRDTGLSHGARQAPGSEALSAAIKAGARLAIWLSERV